jgi:activator of HSP90 ATPase
MSQHIHQEIEFDANPSRVYAALTDAVQFSVMTGGAPAEFSHDAGGAFSCFGGAIVGRQVELAPDQRVVQAWRAANWPAGVYSIVTFELQATGASTRLVFDQSGFPEAEATHLADGWHKMYWEPMRRFLV